MTTSTETNREIATEALQLAGVVAEDEAATGEQMEKALKALGRMLKAWQNRGQNLWAVAEQSVTLTTASVYTLDPIRPVQIQNVRLRQSGRDTMMERMTREEYDMLPNKSSQGTPTAWYYDRQREAARLYIWPVLASASGQTLQITYYRELSDIVAGDAVDVPSEWYDAVVYNLAVRCSATFRTTLRPDVLGLSGSLLDDALAFDREESVFFAGPWAD